jgi:hypothetical protein
MSLELPILSQSDMEMDTIAQQLQAACDACPDKPGEDVRVSIKQIRDRLTRSLPDVTDETYDDLFSRANRIINPSKVPKGRKFPGTSSSEIYFGESGTDRIAGVRR